jgi:hypothetical protein
MDRPIQVVEVIEQFSKQQLVVRLDSSIQRQAQRGQLLTEPSFGHLRQDLGVSLSLLDRLQHAPSTDPDDVTGDRTQFDVGRFQHGCRTRLIS